MLLGKKRMAGEKKMKKLTHKSDRIAFVYIARVCVCVCVVQYDIIILLLLLSSSVFSRRPRAV